MTYSIQNIANIISVEACLPDPSIEIEHLLIDSRRIIQASSSLFFALQSDRKNGEEFIEELYEAGVRNFVVSKQFEHSAFVDANFCKVDDTKTALQTLAAFHRKQFRIPVIGITGSNGKTVVKEWLYQLLHDDYNIVRSPKSYNSQIGVPLSVWQMNEQHTLAIFEAGISQIGEMELLEKIIQPTIGILTNIGVAHSAGFTDDEQKLNEKTKLFDNANLIICNTKNKILSTYVNNQTEKNILTWGRENATINVLSIEKNFQKTTIACQYNQATFSFEIPFTDDASIENAMTCCCALLYLHTPIDDIKHRMKNLQPVEMRLQMKSGINNCLIINDSYSNDLSSLQIALNFLQQQGNLSKTVILSDLGEVNSTDDQYHEIADALVQHKIDKFIGIGPRLFSLQSIFKTAINQSNFFLSVEEFKQHFVQLKFREESVLIKGARSFKFEEINLLFAQKVHQTALEVNLTAMVHNLKEYQRFLQPNTKVMAMVKAFSYGSGSAEVASILQFHKVDYLAVAYADEGVELRKAGIQMPIMVMNPEEVTFPSLVEYNLEPELYSFNILNAFIAHLENEGLQQFPVHIKIDTGMHRLGFEQNDISRLIEILSVKKELHIKSVFSHLVASENEEHDAFTTMQSDLFLSACDKIYKAVGYPFIKHIANSAAIFRHPDLQLDMVRLGIGLYGVDSTAQKQVSLLPVASLKTTIAQIREVKKHESIGYSRKGILHRDSKIATIRIGYADGLSRKLGNGVGNVFVNGKLAPIAGNICMDMTMIDVTDIKEVKEGDFVEIFGNHIHVEQVAKWCDTIAYEIMTSVSQRVKREYYLE